MASFSPEYFDPLSTSDLTAIICRQFEQQESHPLADLPRFTGAGLYAIYYSGTKESLYVPLRDCLIPLYVGSARSHDSATGGSAPTSSPLRDRLREHEESINASSLDLSEFRVRLLLMPDVHIALGENGLRVGYKPVWNAILRGFGNHDPGGGRRDGEETAWDCVHPGRSRTHGKKRRDRLLLIALAHDLIVRQRSELGTTGGLDWSKHSVDAIVASRLPKSKARKIEWVNYVVDVHDIDREIAKAMTKDKLTGLALSRLLEIGKTLDPL